jgi:cell division protease FtsH
MTTFLDLLNDRYDAFALDGSYGLLDVQNRPHVKAGAAIAAVMLDSAGVSVDVVRKKCSTTIIRLFDDSMADHVRKFLIGCVLEGHVNSNPSYHSIDEDADPAPYVVDRVSSRDDCTWFPAAFSAGAGVVFLVDDGRPIYDRVRKFIDHEFEIPMILSSDAVRVAKVVAGVDIVLPHKIGFDVDDLLVAIRRGKTAKEIQDRLIATIPVDELAEIAASAIDALSGMFADSDGAAETLGDSSEKVVTKLSDLSGYGPAKDWGMQLASDLADYRAGKLAWDDVDKGILLSGPPGCGKTYFASALAAECGVELRMTSYGEWHTASSGDTVARSLKKLFEEWRAAAKSGPVIVFVDEIDSVGVRGDSNHSDGWYRTIINSWLAFLDGAAPRAGIVVIAATNLPDRVDPALKRPGRLDRHVDIPYPGIDDLRGVIRHHLPSDADLTALDAAARACRGLSPADVAQRCREARRMARAFGRPVRAGDVMDAVWVVRGKVDPAKDWLVCVHEAGHALVGVRTGLTVEYIDADRQHGKFPLPEIGRREWILGEVATDLGGIAAEEAVFGEHSAGAISDLEQATKMARMLHTQVGMGRSGLVSVSSDDYRFAPHLHDAVARTLDDCRDRARSIINRDKHLLLKLARRLQRDRYLDAGNIDTCLTFDGPSWIRRERVDPDWPAPCEEERSEIRRRRAA